MKPQPTRFLVPRRAATDADGEPGRDAADRLGPADQPDGAAVGTEDLEHEDDVQDDEDALGQLARGADADERPEAGDADDRPPAVDPVGGRTAGRAARVPPVASRHRARGGHSGPAATRVGVGCRIAAPGWPPRGPRRRGTSPCRPRRRPARPRHRDDEPAQRRAEQPGEAAGEGREAVRLVASSSAGHEHGHERRLRGGAEPGEARLGGGDEIHDPQLVRAGRRRGAAGGGAPGGGSPGRGSGGGRSGRRARRRPGRRRGPGSAPRRRRSTS